MYSSSIFPYSELSLRCLFGSTFVGIALRFVFFFLTKIIQETLITNRELFGWFNLCTEVLRSAIIEF